MAHMELSDEGIINDKGCIICEKGEQKQLCWNDLSEQQKSDFFYDLSHQK